jgi:uncharacterized protein
VRRDARLLGGVEVRNLAAAAHEYHPQACLGRPALEEASIAMQVADGPGVCALAVMAKAPRTGEVKTRLVPPLRADEAAILSGCFLKDIAASFLAAGKRAPVDGYVAYSPSGADALFRELVPADIKLLPPRRSGLGESLGHAVQDLLAAGYFGACLVNADSPTLPTSLLIEAVEALRRPGDRVVLGPAADGGYYLIGLKQPHRRLFEEIAWSTDRVLRQTMERAASMSLDVVTLAPWYDVDDAQSLNWLCNEIIGGRRPPGCERDGNAAPHTAAYLRQLMASAGAERIGVDRLILGRATP